MLLARLWPLRQLSSLSCYLCIFLNYIMSKKILCICINIYVHPYWLGTNHKTHERKFVKGLSEQSLMGSVYKGRGMIKGN